ncbi:MAG: ABC transporter ATP-binding protein [Candidatus Nomurabacteria bacterium]|nr:MAG: ABC transporter ATP-binding protein [Candidatus Nomurabacteria bacterium]
MKEIVRIIRFSRSLWRYYVGISLFTIVLAIISQLQPLFTKGAIDEITRGLGHGHTNVELVAIFAILIFVTDVAQTLLSNVSGYLGDMMSAKLQRYFSIRYYEHLLELPQSYFDTELTGKIINRMSRGISQISNFMQMMSNNFLQFIFGTVFSLIVVAYYSWPVALMLFTLYPIFILFTAKSSKKWQNYQTEINEQNDIASGRFNEAIGQVRVVKSFVRELAEIAFFRKRFDKIVKTTSPQSLFWHRQDIYRRLVLNIIFLGVFVYIFVETANGHYTIGTMVLLIQYAMLIRVPIFSISFLVDQSQRAVSNTKDYFEVMDLEAEITDKPDATKLTVKQALIEFDDVSFSYDKSPVLSGLNFSIEPDTKVALVGESGEGKTTITSLLLRLYEPQGGSILIDGQNINQVSQSSLRKAIGVVFQDAALFSGTIRENIAYSNPQASDQDVIDAAKSANADEFISKLEKGYDTEIGERGLKLSGGQKQRIAIARAFLKDAPILILDEATSSLDSKSEQMVQEGLKRLMKGRSTLIIAHRLSTIQNVDKIVTLQGGAVKETGSPQDLASSGGIYAELLKLQQGNDTKSEKKLKKFDLSR